MKKDYDEWLGERLSDPQEAAAYLQANLRPCADETEDEHKQIIACVLWQIGKAYGVDMGIKE